MRHDRPAHLTLLLLLPAAALLAADASAYPIDGARRTGIRRLTGQQNTEAQPGRRAKLWPGALLPTSAITLSLADVNETWDLVGKPRDPALQAAVASVFANRDPSYGFLIIDITHPDDIVWAGIREDLSQYPGSVGKVLCMTALFDGLRRAFPDVATRERILRETVLEADDWTAGDSHKMPHFVPGTGLNRWAPASHGDKFTLSEWLDHAISASANSAGSMIWREAILLRALESGYPGTAADRRRFFETTPKAELQRLSQAVIDDTIAAAGLDTNALQQGTMFTRGGQARIPGIASFASPRELARFLLRMEQGRLVDDWSSLEMKRYMYITKKRYRYCHPPELAHAAVYFKSGSLYDCEPEAGFKCGKYKGNVKNYMNSIAIIESPAERGSEQKRYIVALLSNVLRVNSAWDHARLAAAIEEAVQTRKPTQVKDAASPAQVEDAGRAE